MPSISSTLRKQTSNMSKMSIEEEDYVLEVPNFSIYDPNKVRSPEPSNHGA